ncbi:MerR family transcriptional regulator [Candidatus Dependentiae bacterium]|nr:MerR family transcriptional regulator [Candidatus Dependentiae bacterium]
MRKRKGFYSISVVAKMFSVHQQTIRMYEKQGLITPKRSEGNTRLFSEDDVDRLEEVIYLTHKLGVNLAGVEMILKLQKKIKRMQDEMNKVFKEAEDEIEEEKEQLRQDIGRQAQQLAGIRKDNKTEKLPVGKQQLLLPDEKQPKKVATRKHAYDDVEPDIAIDDFEIEYEKD